MAGCRRRFAVAARGRAARILAGFFSWLVLGGFAISASAHEGRPAALRDVAFEQRLNERLPLEIPFRDETGRAVRLGDYFGARPAVLALVYYRCEDLCPLTLDGLVRSLRALSFDAGREFDVVVISFDPRDTPALAAAKKEETVRRYGRDGASGGWHFLTGGRDAIARLTEAVGFRPTYETERDRYAHATGIVLATPEGRLSRYLYGITFSPRDLRLALVEASQNKIGSVVDQLLLFCYHYDPTTGRYGLLITSVVRLAGAATVIALGGFIVGMLVREKKNRPGRG